MWSSPTNFGVTVSVTCKRGNYIKKLHIGHQEHRHSLQILGLLLTVYHTEAPDYLLHG